jgi:hypothetical protein
VQRGSDFGSEGGEAREATKEKPQNIRIKNHEFDRIVWEKKGTL